MAASLTVGAMSHRALFPVAGRPIGHWEGDTLVVDSTNYRRWSLDDSYYEDPAHYRENNRCPGGQCRN